MSLAIAEGLKLPKGSRFSIGAVPAAIAGVAPTLDFRPALERREIEAVSLTDKLTFTGGNQGTFVGSDGFIQRATTNIPRFDHDPVTRRSLGMLAEPSSANAIRNSTMNGAAIGAPGTLPANWGITNTAGLTTNVARISIENGIPYIDLQITGTSTGVDYIILYEAATQVTAAIGQTFTSSQYIKQVAGSTANILSISSRLRFGQAGGALTEIFDSAFTLPTVSPSFAGCRVERTATAANASTARVTSGLSLKLASAGAAINITLRIGLPQLEQGGSASTPIPTTTAAVTRTADSAVIDGAGVVTGTYTMVEKPAGCAVVSGTNINLQNGFTVERVMVFPAALTAGQITAIRAAM